MTSVANSKNVILVGMPGSGKSTLGVLLAKRLGLGFIDTDVLIQTREQRTLQQILDSQGYVALRSIEERVLLDLDISAHVISTGGSAVYSEPAMIRLRKQGVVVFLDVPLEEIRRRVRDIDTRGIAAPPGTTLEQLFSERRPLYQKYADATVNCPVASMEKVVAMIVAQVLKLATR